MFYGAKGGSSSAFQQTPDNLRSDDTFEGVLGLCVGPIRGPTKGLQSIKLDGTAIENETGQLNFPDFVATIGDGDPLKFPQPVQLKLGAGAAPAQVGLSLTNPQLDGHSPGVWVTKTLNNTNANFIDLRFLVQQLYRQDSKGVYNLTATLDIQMKPTGSKTWITPALGTPSTTYDPDGIALDDGSQLYLPKAYFLNSGSYAPQKTNYQITGKTTSAAVYELRIAVPSSGAYANTPWDIRVRLEERDTFDDGNGNQEKRSISWESMAAVYANQIGTADGWRGLAWMQFYGKASDQLTGVPEVTGEYDTKIMQVPSTFDGDARTYAAGIWDGSWSKAWTNDPAWVINDAISDELSGVSLIAIGSYLNKWDGLELSKWCSQLVPDGAGGYEPRFSLNLSISTPQKAEEFVRYLAGAVGALAWDQGDGEWRCKADKPDNPIDLFTLDNIQGEFVYSHTDVDTRYNAIIGQFKNAEMDYRADSVELYDNQSIALIGQKPTTIALVGCTGRQEAMRRVKLRLRSAVNENRIVTFTTNRRGRNVEPLSTILVADGDLGDQDKRTTGRLVAISADRQTVTVRDPMYLAPGLPYQLQFAMPNPAYGPDTNAQPTDPDWTKPTVVKTFNVVGTTGITTTLKLDTALPADIADNLAVALTSPTLPTLPRLFRVTNVTIGDDGETVSVSAINIDIGKWDASDNVSKQDTVFQDLRGAAPMPQLVNGQPLLTLVRVPIEQGDQINLQANWQRPASAFISGFRIQYSVNGGALQTAVDRQQTAEWELPNAGPGVYHVEVSTIDRRGGYSLPLVGDLEVTQGLIDATQVKYQSGDTIESLKPAEIGATFGAPTGSPFGNTTVDAFIAQMHDVEGDISDLQTAVANNTGPDLTALKSDVAQAKSDIGQAQTDLNSVKQTVSSYTSKTDAAASAVTTEIGNRTSADSALAGRIDTVTTSVGQNSTIIGNEVIARTNADQALGGRIDNLSTTVGQNTAAVGNEVLARTNADNALADRTSSLEAVTRSSSPNLVVNGDFGDTLSKGWTNYSGSFFVVGVGGQGAYTIGPFVQAGSGYSEIYQDISVEAGNQFSLSYEADPDNTGDGYVYVEYLNASNGRTGYGANVSPNKGWVRASSAPVAAPSGTTKARIHVVKNNNSNTFRATRIQFQRGAATAWNPSATGWSIASRMTTEESVRSTADSALATRASNLEATVNGSSGVAVAQARITDEVTARVNAVSAVSSQVNTLTASLAALAAPNLLANGSFANGFSGWNYSSNNWNVVYQYQPIFAQIQANDYSSLWTDVTGIQQGLNYCMGFESDSDAGDNHVYLCLRWYDTNGNQINGDINGTSSPGHNGWGNRVNNGPYRAPSGAIRARIQIYVYGSNSSATQRVSRVQFQQSDQPTAYSDAASLQGLQAQVSTQQAAIADITQNKLAAYWQVATTAGNQSASISAVAQANGQAYSAIEIIASQFTVKTGSGNKPVLAVSGNNVVINGGLVVTDSIVDNSVTTVQAVSLGNNMAGSNNNFLTPLSSNFYLDRPAVVTIIFTGVHSYSNTLPEYEARPVIDGQNYNGVAGGLGFSAESFSFTWTGYLGAGNHTLQMQWRGGSSDITLIGGSTGFTALGVKK